MSMTDPVGDFLTRIRNGIMAGHEEVNCPRSNIKVRIAEILKAEGYIDAVSTSDSDHQGSISMTLRYDKKARSAIEGLKRLSKPGQRQYVPAKKLPKVRNGLGVAIVSTSHGVMTDQKARELGVGGEVLCEVW